MSAEMEEDCEEVLSNKTPGPPDSDVSSIKIENIQDGGELMESSAGSARPIGSGSKSRRRIICIVCEKSVVRRGRYYLSEAKRNMPIVKEIYKLADPTLINKSQYSCIRCWKNAENTICNKKMGPQDAKITDQLSNMQANSPEDTNDKEKPIEEPENKETNDSVHDELHHSYDLEIKSEPIHDGGEAELVENSECNTAAQSDSAEPTYGRKTHRMLCIICGKSVLRTRRYVLAERTQEQHLPIIQEISKWTNTSMFTQSDYCCSTCWLKALRYSKKKENKSNEGRATDKADNNEPGKPTPLNQIKLINYKRSLASKRKCFFPGCNGRIDHLITREIRLQCLIEHNYYIPEKLGVCNDHQSLGMWDTLASASTSLSNFSAGHVEDMIKYLKRELDRRSKP